MGTNKIIEILNEKLSKIDIKTDDTKTNLKNIGKQELIQELLEELKNIELIINKNDLEINEGYCNHCGTKTFKFSLRLDNYNNLSCLYCYNNQKYKRRM